MPVDNISDVVNAIKLIYSLRDLCEALDFESIKEIYHALIYSFMNNNAGNTTSKTAESIR